MLGADPDDLQAAKVKASLWRRGIRTRGQTPDGTPILVSRPSARHRWWLWEPKTWRARISSIAALVTRPARALTVRFDEAMEHTATLIAAITRIRSLNFP